MATVPAGRYHVTLLHYRDEVICTPDVADKQDFNVTEHYKMDDLDLPSFRIDKRPVGLCDYLACVKQHACPPLEGLTSCDPRTLKTILDEHAFTYPQANAYCGWRGLRLPTYNEWEAAMFGTQGPKPDPACERHSGHGGECEIVTASGVHLWLEQSELTRSRECRWPVDSLLHDPPSPPRNAPVVAFTSNWFYGNPPESPMGVFDEGFANFRCVADSADVTN